jgi:RNA recognition motif-containing protein
MNIYVGNLSYKVDENELRNTFEEYGSVSSVKIISDKFTGRSKGFGFVEMEDDTEGQKAIDELNGKSIDNRNITVNVARERRENRDDRRRY